ncbi:WbqC family protein [Methanococcoides alaskense]|uniref:WbqC-like protein family protein n=1 Tax=Methanococcoides alaskense TaxID=325778 RepID=A0AA90TZV0_9EURY|nr:WbqC family protein [Methanococcoides alaskense]MDA0524839.1 WbqC family protein [Methanococcoides alaskense]MDR6223037.1 hypothetical protein [Methanococcoides alaskense]
MGKTVNIAIMQPYFLPYIGYWQLINAVDKFVVYDNIQFTKKSWIRRNRILQNGKDFLFTIPLKSGSDYLDIRERLISDKYFDTDADKFIRKMRDGYRKAPYFNEAMPSIEKCIRCDEKNLFTFIWNSIKTISEYLEIHTEIIISSQVEMDHLLKGQERVLEICRHLSATSYINAIGGLELYDKETFEAKGIELKFIKSETGEYDQFGNEFVPNLSIIDVMMFNSKNDIKKMLGMYDIIRN